MQSEDDMKGMVAGSCLAPSQSAEALAAAMAPMETYLRNAKWGDKIYAAGIPLDYPDFAEYWATQPPQDAGFSGRLGSRILDEKALTGDIEKLKSALKATTPVPWNTLGHAVAGPGTWKPPSGILGGSNAVGPAWRSAVTHIGESFYKLQLR